MNQPDRPATLADEIRADTAREAARIRTAALVEGAAALEALDPVEAALAGQHAWSDAAKLLRRLAGEQPTQDEPRTTWTPGPVAVAQAGEAACVTAAAYLATPCDTCEHTLNWHRNDVGCTVAHCVCSRFAEAPGAC